MSNAPYHIYDVLEYGHEAYNQDILEITVIDSDTIQVRPVLLTPEETQDFIDRCKSIGARPGPLVAYNDGTRRPEYWTLPKTIEAEFSNDFHGTSISVRAKITPHQILLSPGQIRKIEAELCGMSDCECGGMRGRQEWEIVENYSDGSVGIVRK